MSGPASAVLYVRKMACINTDPQRRCYNGANFSEAWVWGPWEVLDSFVEEGKAERALAYWRDLNAYAVKERGRGAVCEFKVEPS